MITVSTEGYSRKKYLGGEDGRRYIFLWVVGAESFQIIKKKLFVAFPWVETSTGPGGFMICVFII